MRSRRILRAGRICRRVWISTLYCETWLLGSGGAVQCGEARMDGRDRRMPERGRNLHRMHDARLSGQIHAVYEPTPGIVAVVPSSTNVWSGDSRAPAVYPGVFKQGT